MYSISKFNQKQPRSFRLSPPGWNPINWFANQLLCRVIFRFPSHCGVTCYRGPDDDLIITIPLKIEKAGRGAILFPTPQFANTFLNLAQTRSWNSNSLHWFNLSKHLGLSLQFNLDSLTEENRISLRNFCCFLQLPLGGDSNTVITTWSVYDGRIW